VGDVNCRPHYFVVVLGVLGGAVSGGFCFGVLLRASPPRKARLGGLKEFTGRSLRRSHCVI